MFSGSGGKLLYIHIILQGIEIASEPVKEGAVKYSEQIKLATYLYLFGRICRTQQLWDIRYSVHIQQNMLYSLQGFSSQQLLCI
jgi:hypothetical protein